MNIMLACCAGMSTSLVVAAMQESAKKQGKDICAKTGEGMDEWYQWLRDQVSAWKTA